MDISVGSGYPAAQRDGTTLRLSQIAKALKRHALLIVVCAVVAAVLAYMYARDVPRTYTASTSIAVEGAGFAIPELQGALRSDSGPDPMPFVRTEVQALTSPGLVRQVVKELNLEADPEFNSALQPPAMMDAVKDYIRSLMPASNTPGARPVSANEAVLGAVTKAMSVFQDNRSLVIGLSFTCQDPDLAAKFVNTLTNDYIKARAEHRDAADRGANGAINQRITDVKAGLDKIEQQMQDLRSRGDIVLLRAGSVGQQQVEELATAAAKASVDRAALEANWNRATSLAKSGSSDALAGVLDSPTVSRLRDQESQASSKLAELSSKYGSGYPAVRSAAADLASVRGQLNGEVSRIITSLGAQLKVARDKEADLQNQLSAARVVGVKAGNAQAQLDQLQQEATTRRALYQTLLEREQQTVAQPVGASTPDVRVLNVATPPGMPSGPNTKLIVGLGGLSGGMLGCLLALLRLGSVDGFSDAGAVVRETGMPVSATLRRNWLRRGLASRVLTTPDGPEAEALQSLRARLRFAGRTEVPRVVLFIPSLRGGDAGELAAAFARVAAAAGENVLLIEADLAAHPLGRILGIRADGLVSVLQGETDWRDATAADPRSPLDVLITERKTASTTGLMRGVPMQNLLIEARQQYDLVVLSGPAAANADFSTLVLRAETTVVMLDGKTGNTPTLEAIGRLGGQSGGTMTSVLVA